MADADSPRRITTLEALREVFGVPSERSLRKEMPRLGDAYRIDRSEMPSFSRMIHEHIHGESSDAEDVKTIAPAGADREAKNQRRLY